MSTIDGIEVFPLISLIIFVLFFGALIWWVLTADKNTMQEMSNYPLNENETDLNQQYVEQ